MSLKPSIPMSVNIFYKAPAISNPIVHLCPTVESVFVSEFNINFSGFNGCVTSLDVFTKVRKRASIGVSFPSICLKLSNDTLLAKLPCNSTYLIFWRLRFLITA